MCVEWDWIENNMLEKEKKRRNKPRKAIVSFETGKNPNDQTITSTQNCCNNKCTTWEQLKAALYPQKQQREGEGGERKKGNPMVVCWCLSSQAHGLERWKDERRMKGENALLAANRANEGNHTSGVVQSMRPFDCLLYPNLLFLFKHQLFFFFFLHFPFFFLHFKKKKNLIIRESPSKVLCFEIGHQCTKL